MSLKVLLIPEDFVKDQFILGPIVPKLVAAAGKPRARVAVCLDPRLRGVDEALDWETIEGIIDRYPMVDMFLLLIDRDGKADRRKAIAKIEENAAKKLGTKKILFGENAWQEVEVWALAGQDALPTVWKWQTIRDEPHPKETYFEPHAQTRGLRDEPGEGRTTMGREAAANYAKIRSRCKEIEELEIRLRKWFEAT
jgi:hypothetical protein